MPILRPSGSDFTSFVKAAAQYVPAGTAAKASKSGGVSVALPGLGAVVRTSQVGALASPTTSAVVINGVTAPASGGGAAAGAFSPAGIAGLALWFDAADASTVTISSGSNISAWKDKSSNAISLVLDGTPPPYPTYVANVVNGMPAVDTSQSNNSTPVTLQASIPTTLFPNFVNTYIEVMTMTTSPPWNVTVEYTHLTNGTHWYRPSFYTSNSNIVQYSDGVYTPGATIPTGSIPNVQLTTTSNTGTSSGISLNGSNATTGSGVTLSTNPNIFYITGRRCEIILYNRVLSAAEQSKVQGYLAWKWGQQSNLPAGHPYKSAAPTA